ncbi:MAG: hypothetical protein PHO75_04595 [Candidatus Shapirobacteria bacterium]|nr:hypothetical protein [Candidatus Shapirobacteria bacterium]
MENHSPENTSNQEYKSEIRLTPQVVQKIYQDTVMRSSQSGQSVLAKDLINDELFNKDNLEQHRKTIEKLADQLQPRFFNIDTGGADSRYAIYDKYQNQWTNSNNDYKQLLALISAIGLGKVTTARAYLNRAPVKEKSVIRYLIDKESYIKEYKRQTYIYGDIKH